MTEHPNEREGNDGAGAGGPARPPAAPRPRLLLTLSGLIAAAVVLFLLVRGRPTPEEDPPPPGPQDPRLWYAGPFRNVHPSVGYVPDSRCAECHADVAASYAEHPMGRSLFPITGAPAPPNGPEQKNPFHALGARLQVERRGDAVRHLCSLEGPGGRPIAELGWEVHYAIGSGTRGHSYLTDKDGYLLQTPVSWYSQKGAWDLSPGFTPALLSGRQVFGECLFCHVNRANQVEGPLNRYRQPVFDGHAIGCQRCHGPGELHVSGKGRGKGADGIDPTIVNPKHLTPTLRQAVCEQCHLQGAARTLARGQAMYDFRPGMPLEEFRSVFIRAAEADGGRKAIGHVEQMYESRCFQGDAGPRQLGCVSCHDPHERVPPQRRVSHYRARCLQCHADKGCSVPPPERARRSPQDSCIDCHMPRYGASDIPHTAATDHRIPRDGKAAPRPGARPPREDRHTLLSFYRGRKGVKDEEDDRGRALAVVRLALMGDAAVARGVWDILPVLEGACRRDPHDLPAWEARGYALSMHSQPTDALAVFRAVLAQAPEREDAVVGAAMAAEALGQAEAARGYWRRAVALNPHLPGYRRSLALLLTKKEEWAEARAESEAWVRLDPFSAEARATRVSCLLALGAKAEARAEFARIEALAPPNLHELQIRFGRKLR